MGKKATPETNAQQKTLVVIFAGFGVTGGLFAPKETILIIVDNPIDLAIILTNSLNQQHVNQLSYITKSNC